MAFSGAILFFTPRGRVANWTDWTMLGLGKEEWGALHINNSILFLLVAVLHIYLNWTMLWGYVKKRASMAVNLKWELAAAAVITVVVLAGTMYGLPPFSTIMAWQRDIKDYWEGRTARAPVPHAEEYTLQEFAEVINVSMEDTADALEKEGFQVQGPTQTVGQLAEQKNVAPNDVLAAIEKHFPTAGAFPGQGRGMGRGRGMGAGGGAGYGPRHEGDVAPDTGHSEDAAGEHDAGHGEMAGMGPGQGLGRGGGPGMGRGQGRGMGLGGGRGMGWGRGTGHAAEDEGVDPSN
jgi:hypothetical protein